MRPAAAAAAAPDTVAGRAPVRAWGRFFSSSGRSSILRLAGTLAAAGALLAAIFPLFDLDSFVAYCGGGALIGGILAKVVAELGRRLHDAGWGGWAGWEVTGALLWLPVDGMANLGWAPAHPRQALAIALVAVLLLRPGVRRPNR